MTNESITMDLTPDPMHLIKYCRQAYAERAQPYARRVFKAGWPDMNAETIETILSCAPDQLAQELVNATICHFDVSNAMADEYQAKMIAERHSQLEIEESN